MNYQLLSKEDMRVMDALKKFHGGSRNIVKTIEKMRGFETRKKALKKKGFGSLIDDAEKWVKDFPKSEDYTKKNNFRINPKYGTARSQVSGFQGAYVTHHAMRRIAESSRSNEPCFAPTEMISVVALTDHYVYSGDLLATLTMSENIMKASKFCSTNLIGTPQPESRFKKLEKVTGKKFERRDLGKGISQLILKNQGTFFGNFGGIEVANDNHLIYLDGITRAAMETGGNFYLNPSWSTITSVCYYARDIENLSHNNKLM